MSSVANEVGFVGASSTVDAPTEFRNLSVSNTRHDEANNISDIYDESAAVRNTQIDLDFESTHENNLNNNKGSAGVTCNSPKLIVRNDIHRQSIPSLVVDVIESDSALSFDVESEDRPLLSEKTCVKGETPGRGNSVSRLLRKRAVKSQSDGSSENTSSEVRVVSSRSFFVAPNLNASDLVATQIEGAGGESRNEENFILLEEPDDPDATLPQQITYEAGVSLSPEKLTSLGPYRIRTQASSSSESVSSDEDEEGEVADDEIIVRVSDTERPYFSAGGFGEPRQGPVPTNAPSLNSAAYGIWAAKLSSALECFPNKSLSDKEIQDCGAILGLLSTTAKRHRQSLRAFASKFFCHFILGGPGLSLIRDLLHRETQSGPSSSIILNTTEPPPPPFESLGNSTASRGHVDSGPSGLPPLNLPAPPPPPVVYAPKPPFPSGFSLIQEKCFREHAQRPVEPPHQPSASRTGLAFPSARPTPSYNGFRRFSLDSPSKTDFRVENFSFDKERLNALRLRLRKTSRVNHSPKADAAEECQDMVISSCDSQGGQKRRKISHEEAPDSACEFPRVEMPEPVISEDPERDELSELESELSEMTSGSEADESVSSSCGVISPESRELGSPESMCISRTDEQDNYEAIMYTMNEKSHSAEGSEHISLSMCESDSSCSSDLFDSVSSRRPIQDHLSPNESVMSPYGELSQSYHLEIRNPVELKGSACPNRAGFDSSLAPLAQCPFDTGGYDSFCRKRFRLPLRRSPSSHPSSRSRSPPEQLHSERLAIRAAYPKKGSPTQPSLRWSDPPRNASVRPPRRLRGSRDRTVESNSSFAFASRLRNEYYVRDEKLKYFRSKLTDPRVGYTARSKYEELMRAIQGQQLRLSSLALKNGISLS